MDWPQYPPQRANPGGTLSPSQVIGRQPFIDGMWHALEIQSVLLTAERRLGKSSVLAVMESNPPEDALIVRRDLENVRTPLEFVERLLDDVRPSLTAQKRARERFDSLLARLGGIEVAGTIKLPLGQNMHWKTHLEAVMADLLSNEARQMIFLWDEMPWMLDNIRQQPAELSGELAAMEILDTLRALRQRHPKLRMVFTGSVGLHHVMGALQRAGHGNAATNDMLFLDLPALSREDAMGLAWSLLQGEGMPVQSPEIVVPAIVDTMNCLPFHIHHLVARLANRGQILTLNSIAETTTSLLTDPHDPCCMRDHETRIRRYYSAEDRPIALSLLDLLARAGQALSFTDLCNQLRHRQRKVDEETIRTVLYLLASDHYLRQNASGAYLFRFPLIAKAWTIRRGL
jgi:hypothetical protein